MYFIKALFTTCFVCLLLVSSRLYAQFPYKEAFTSGSIGAKTVFGDSTTLIDGVLRLTDDREFQMGYLYIDIPFSSTYGIKTSFEYFDYGGTGADGIAFFLFDATVQASDFRIGAFGGSLGYAQRNTGPGLKGAYMGIGFDDYGNFGIANESKIGGVGNGTTRLPDGVVIRGPESENYKFIAGMQTSTAPFNYNISSRTATRVTNPDSPGYRKIYVDLQPLPVGYTVVVKMDIGGVVGTKTLLTVNYPFPAPPLLKMGFSASSGGSTNFHEIDNVHIAVSNEAALINPVANNDNGEMCADGSSIIISVLSNDTLKNDAPTNFDVTKLDLDPVQAGIQSSYSVNGKGNFVANSDGTVTFTRSAGFTGGIAEIYYTISDNYNKTSNQGKITATVHSLPAIQVSTTLVACETADLRTAITGDYSGLVLKYYKSVNGNKILKTEAEISTLDGSDNGTYYIEARNAAGCIIEKEVQVSVNIKPASPFISLLL